MKKILFAFVILAAGYCAAASLIGLQIESRMDVQAARLSKLNPQSALTIVQKRRGIFTSDYTARFTTSLPLPGGDGSLSSFVISVDLSSHVIHGPVVFHNNRPHFCLATAETTVSRNAGTAPSLIEFINTFPELSQFVVFSHIAFNGYETFAGVIPASSGTIQTKDGPVHMEWRAATYTGDGVADLSKASRDFKCPLIRIETPRVTTSLAGMRYFSTMYTVNEGDSHLWGSSTLSSDSVDMQSHGKPLLHADAISVDISATPHGDVFDEIIALGGNWKHPSGKVMPVAATLTVSHLALAAMDKLLAAHTGSSGNISPTDTMAFLAGSNMSFSLSFLAGTPHAVTLNASVDASNMKQIPADISTIDSLLRGEATFDAPDKALVELGVLLTAPIASQIAETRVPFVSSQLDRFVAGGFLVRNGDRLSSKAVWDGHSLIVNGKPVPLGGSPAAPASPPAAAPDNTPAAPDSPAAPANPPVTPGNPAAPASPSVVPNNPAAPDNAPMTPHVDSVPNG